MHLAHKSFTKIIYLLAFLATTIVISLLPSPSHATVQSQQLPISINPHNIQVNSDDSLSLFHCQQVSQSGSTSEYAFAHTFDLTTFRNKVSRSYIESSRPATERCLEFSGNGRGYLLEDGGAYHSPFTYQHSFNRYGTKLVKQEEDILRWQIGFDGCNSQDQGYASSLTQGFDGDIYFIVPACNASDQALFVGIDNKTGYIKFTLPMIASYSGLTHGHQVHAYSDGIVILDENNIRFFNYSGEENASRSFSIQLPTTHISETLVDPNGTAYVRLLGTENSHYCTTPAQNSIYYKKIDGQDGCIVFSGEEYANFSSMTLDPNGGIVIATLPKDYNANYILRYDEDGVFRNASLLPAGTGYTIPMRMVYHFRVDTEGNAIFVQNIQRHQTPRYTHANIYKITPDGQVSTLLTTRDINIFNQTTNYFANSTKAGLAEDKIYIALCKGVCSGTNHPYIYTIPSIGTSREYPNNLIGSAIPDHDIDNDGDGLTKWQEIQQGTSDDNVDSDGDGLNDFLESRWNPNRHDLFCNNDRSVCEYPNPTEKDVYVEVDWMTRPAEGSIDSYTTKPSEDQINEIKEAFADKGIHAHFDTGQLGGGNEVPYNHVVKFGVIPGEVDFYDYKKGGDGISANFNPDRYQIYHYMLSGHRYNDTSPANSGIALVSDDDFFVAFGSLKEDFGLILPGSTEKAITGTIIHELGHNLCLTSNTHDDPACSFEGIDDNYGNSYPSAMNYDKQFDLIDYSTGQNGSGDHDDWSALRLHDFASSNLGDEAHDLLQSMQQQSVRMRAPLELQPQYRELQNKLREFERSIE